MSLALALAALVLAALPAAVFLANLRLYRTPPAPPAGARRPRVAVLIPARDEEGTIADAVRSALASEGVDLEVVVLDDGSKDRTAEVVATLAEADPRVRLERAPALPAGWNGKVHACATLAERADRPILAFVDADVRLEPQGLARAIGFLESSGADLVSGIPRQVTVTPVERLLIPLIHFVLLGFLPIWRMRRSLHPAYGAGTGQLVLVRREAYLRAGGHGAIRSSRHDGVHLPQAFRRAGLRTDLFDATRVAWVRMYESGRATLRGLEKNADQGLGAPRLIGPITGLLLGGQVLPFALLTAAPLLEGPVVAVAAAAAAAGLVVRLASAARFEQPLDSALLHPLGVLLLLAVQWTALVRRALGRPAVWKGRAYPGLA